MPDTITPVLNEKDTRDAMPIIHGTVLSSSLDELFIAAQPRLERLAHVFGVAPDNVDDVVQETLVEAWRQLEHLHDAERFDAWLNGICRNMSLRWKRAQGIVARRLHPFPGLLQSEQEEGTTEDLVLNIPDPLAIDPLEELNRQELAVLLDRAMKHLPIATREALELHYIADLPQREVAQRLGLTINALEVKLHRAWHQLRQIFNRELRTDAEAFGLILDSEMAHGWRETSIWCFICGRQHMIGLFVPRPDGSFSMRLRCRVCSQDNIDIVNSGSIGLLKSTHSFRPALKRIFQALPEFHAQVLTKKYHVCFYCNNHTASFRGIEAYTLPSPFYNRFTIVRECASCGTVASGVISFCLAHPVCQQFIERHPRCIIEPEKYVEYEGQPAIRCCLKDLLSTSKLIFFLHKQTLQVLAFFQE